MNRGFKVGAYWYSYALDTDAARREGEYCREIIDVWGGLLELPVFYDQEDADGWRDRNGIDYSQCTDMCDAFADGHGLRAGVYANYDWFTNHLDFNHLKDRYVIWLAQYNYQPDLQCDIWQYSDQEWFGNQKLDADISYMEG